MKSLHNDYQLADINSDLWREEEREREGGGREREEGGREL